MLTAPLLLLIRIWRQARAYWFWYFPIAILSVWTGGSIAAWCHHEDLWQQIEQYEARGEQAPRALVDAWASDASVAMLRFFGWIPGALYACICASLFLIVRTLFRSVGRRAQSAEPGAG